MRRVLVRFAAQRDSVWLTPAGEIARHFAAV
jgi:hypothetical protein